MYVIIRQFVGDIKNTLIKTELKILVIKRA